MNEWETPEFHAEVRRWFADSARRLAAKARADDGMAPIVKLRVVAECVGASGIIDVVMDRAPLEDLVQAIRSIGPLSLGAEALLTELLQTMKDSARIVDGKPLEVAP